MKRIVSLLLAVALCHMALSARTYALVVGVSSYENANNNLSQTTKDAKSFKTVMETQTKDITLLTSKYANKANVVEKLRAICNRAQSSDRIVFYFSGHGIPGGICCFDNVLQYSELVNLLATSAAKDKICYIDACHAGTVAAEKAGPTDLATTLKGHSDQIYFVGCRSNEYSIEGPMVGAGFFTQGLIKGLRGKCDRNGDKKITVIELFKYIYNDVVTRSQSKQHPQLIASQSMHNTVVAVW